MLPWTFPPLTRWSQIYGALVAAWGVASWSESQEYRYLPVDFMDLPLPPPPSFLQAWPLSPILTAARTELKEYTPKTLTPEHLLLWGLRVLDGVTVVRSDVLSNLAESDPARPFLEHLHQALSRQGSFPRSLGHWLNWAKQSGFLPETDTRQFSQAWLWGSLYGARYGLGQLPPLWIAQIPPELEKMANCIYGAWVGQLYPGQSLASVAITNPGDLYPRPSRSCGKSLP